jgi:hypothetical protein
MVFQETGSVAAYLHLPLFPSPPPSFSPSVSQQKKKKKKGGSAIKFAAFCLLINKYPINFALLGGNKNTLKKRRHQINLQANIDRHCLRPIPLGLLSYNKRFKWGKALFFTHFVSVSLVLEKITFKHANLYEAHVHVLAGEGGGGGGGLFLRLFGGWGGFGIIFSQPAQWWTGLELLGVNLNQDRWSPHFLSSLPLTSGVGVTMV